jgi:hypothetical protein
MGLVFYNIIVILVKLSEFVGLSYNNIYRIFLLCYVVFPKVTDGPKHVECSNKYFMCLCKEHFVCYIVFK